MKKLWLVMGLRLVLVLLTCKVRAQTPLNANVVGSVPTNKVAGIDLGNDVLRVSNLPHFVGFSYSRATSNPGPSRFIHFLNENLNVNANFLQTHGSFRASRSGVYFFTFSFLSKTQEATILALRLNGQTLVSGLSEAGGHNPVSQSALTLLKPGDVVQLEVLQGQVFEPVSRRQEFAHTSFSGWLIAPTSGHHGPDIIDDRHDHDTCCSRCCHVDPPSTSRPPFYTPPPPTRPPTSYLPPLTRPPYTYTTTQSPAYGRDNCCDTILVSAGAGRSVLQTQAEKFGVYRLVKIDPVDGRAIFKHCENDIFLYYYHSPSGWRGWLSGPVVGAGRGGLILETNAMCVEKGIGFGNQQINWKYYDTVDFVDDPTISVTCFAGPAPNPGRVYPEVGGVGGGGGFGQEADQLHYHHHQHVHKYDQSQGRSLVPPPGPGYKIKSNPDFVEATFVFPNRHSNTSHVPLQSQDLEEAVIEAAARVSQPLEVDDETEARQNGVIARRVDHVGEEEDFNLV